MTFHDIPLKAPVFLDANALVYHFAAHPHLGPECTWLLERIEQGDLIGYTSAHVLSEMAHHLMITEASTTYGWPAQGISRRLGRHPAEVRGLTLYRHAIDEIPLYNVRVLPITDDLVSLAADVSYQTGLLCSDALIVATMEHHGLVHLASNDADFDRAPNIIRYAPI